MSISLFRFPLPAVLQKQKMKIMVSACLLGENCKYNGGNNYSKNIESYVKGHEVTRICPELLGGLQSPAALLSLSTERFLPRIIGVLIKNLETALRLWMLRKFNNASCVNDTIASNGYSRQYEHICPIKHCNITL